MIMPLELLIFLNTALSTNIEKTPVAPEAIIAASIIGTPKVTFRNRAK
jgi:hypothetical protein